MVVVPPPPSPIGKVDSWTCSTQADSASGYCLTYQHFISARSVNNDDGVLTYQDSAVPALRDSLANTGSEGAGLLRHTYSMSCNQHHTEDDYETHR